MAEIIKAQYYPEVREGGEVVKPYPKKVHFETSSDVTLYNNSTSGLTAQTAQAAIDELAVKAVSNKQQINEIDEAITELNEEIENLGSDKVDQADIVDNLTTGGTDKVLSAEQGKTLKGLVDANTQSISELDAEHKLKVASIERELNTCKSVLSSVNVNNEPTQTAEGYGIVNLPKNAANGSMGVKVEGLTATNLVNNGDFSDGITGWNAQDVTLVSAAENELITIATAQYGRYAQTISFLAGHKYYLFATVKATSNQIKFNYDLSEIMAHSGSGNYELLSGIRTFSTSDSKSFRVSDYRTSGWDNVYQKNMGLIDLTAIFGAGNEPTVEQCDAMFANWFDGTKSVATPLRIKSVGKNLFDGQLEQGAIYLSTGQNTASDSHVRWTNYCPVMPNAQYTISRSITGGIAKIRTYGLSKNYLGLPLADIRVSDSSLTITVPASVYFIRIFDATNNLSNTYQVELGSTATAYEPYKVISSLYLPDVGVLRSNGDAADELTATEHIKRIDDDGTTLAVPIITPIQSSGSLISYPSGTVYIEKAIADAGIYNNGITVLNTDKPIATLESVSKIDFATGAETPLGVSTAVITQEGLSFTHPGLTDGDIVFFVYFYDTESTVGETTLTYYDSRYVIKNEDDGKFYQWAIKASGTPPTATIELEEV